MLEQWRPGWHFIPSEGGDGWPPLGTGTDQPSERGTPDEVPEMRSMGVGINQQTQVPIAASRPVARARLLIFWALVALAAFDAITHW